MDIQTSPTRCTIVMSRASGGLLILKHTNVTKRCNTKRIENIPFRDMCVASDSCAIIAPTIFFVFCPTCCHMLTLCSYSLMLTIPHEGAPNHLGLYWWAGGQGGGGFKCWCNNLQNIVFLIFTTVDIFYQTNYMRWRWGHSKGKVGEQVWMEFHRHGQTSNEVENDKEFAI